MSWKDDVWGVSDNQQYRYYEQYKYKCSGCGSEGEILVPKDKNKEVDFKGRLRLVMCLECEPERMHEKGYRSVE